MNDDFAKRVRSAAIAGWWTLLIATAFLTVTWVVYLGAVTYKCPCMLSIWGGNDVQWSTIQTISLWMVAVFKVCLWIAAMIVIWLTLWARKLRKA